MSAADQLSYEDLYARWEHGNWRASELDFSVDREQWQTTFSDLQRRAALWNYAMFFHGEDAVTDALSPYIEAAPREEQKYFLATQQVDEARHAVFFGRFMREVAQAGADIGSSLEATLPELTWGFRRVFARLDSMADELRRDHSLPKLAQAITLYHLIIEGTLAQPGQHFIETYLADADLLPAFHAGLRNVSLDEQRHIGFGVKMLSELLRQDSDCEPAVGELLREVLPWTVSVFIPPGWDERYVTCFGFTLNDIYEHGATAMEGRLRAAGIDVLKLRTGLAFDTPVPERVRQAVTLLKAGYLGEPNGPVRPDAEATAILFEGVRRTVDTSKVRGHATIQWEFTDAEPWHLEISGADASVGTGVLEHPDLRFRCRFEDWIDLAAGRIDPWRAILTRRVRPSGRLVMLLRARTLFE
jgi:hypothetical protein